MKTFWRFSFALRRHAGLVRQSPARNIEKTTVACLLLLLACLFLPLSALAQVSRIVIIKVDGLPPDVVDRYVHERDSQTGKSQLPWIEHVFYRHGTRIANFYVRGMSLSAPSWSMLDTGQHLNIKGNVEFDRYTLHSYDYLNFIPFYLTSALKWRVDMPGPEVLDELGVPLLFDGFPNNERYQSFQLNQRGIRWTTLANSGKSRVSQMGLRDVLDEWSTGIEGREIISGELEREVLRKIEEPQIRYLDFFSGEFDHAAHHNRDGKSQLGAIKHIDEVIGKIWTAIENSKQADSTTLVLVSDHGFNSDENIYSQGFNLVKLLGSSEGGGHHVVTKRRLMMDYSIKGINPLIRLITTTTPDSYYLKGQSTEYPTALLDFDGNERSSIHLRDNDLNLLHILFQQLQRGDLTAQMRSALTDAFFSTLDRRRGEWTNDLKELREELDTLQAAIRNQQSIVNRLPKKWTLQEQNDGKDREALRQIARLYSLQKDQRDYSEYASTASNLLLLTRQNFQPERLKIPDYIATRAMGSQNSIYQLQNYIVGASSDGLKLNPDNSLDMQRSFRRINYFELLHGRTVRNNVQAGVSNRPIDFVAKRIPPQYVSRLFPEEGTKFGDAVWIYGGPFQQALILSKEDSSGTLSLKYVPIQGLTQDANGQITFTRVELTEGFPLRLFEDPLLAVPGESRAAWLQDWHTDLEWLRATHRTTYSNGIVGLNEQLARHPSSLFATDAPGLSEDERLLRRFRLRQRHLVEADMLVLANNHWNFDVRGFNPGGNHGSFFRISTHSTLMFAGGARTGIPEGQVVREPYDSLSFVPTLLTLTGELRNGNLPVSFLRDKGFMPFPGRVITEILGAPGYDPGVTTTMEGDSHRN